MRDGLIVKQDIKSKHVNKDLYLIDIGILTGPCSEYLEGQKLFGILVYGHNLTIQYKRLQLLLMSLHALLDILDQIDIGLGNVLKIPGEDANLPMIIVNLPPKPVILILAGKLLAVEPSQDILQAPGGFGQHGLTRDAQGQLTVVVDLPEIVPDLNEPPDHLLLVGVLRDCLFNAELVLLE